MEPRRRFRIIKELSEGAFGKVYLSEMITGDNFKSVVAIKLLHGKWAGHEEIVQRSRDEARVLGLIHHRNIIRVEDLTSINGQCAVVMEYLNGVDMKTLCTYVRERDSQIPRKVVLEITAQIASALDAAYTHRPLQGGEPLELIHRDIKPSNVMLTCAGEVKVLDFGTAQARFDHREAQTQALAFGSAAYMAPERLLGDQDQPWGDVFSLGITLYEMLSLQAFGKVQVRPERNAEHLATCLGDLDLGDLPAEQGKELKAFLSRMLSYQPEDRPTAMEVVTFMEDLSDLVNDGSVRRFCREVVTPCRETVEPVQDPNDPLAGSTLFEDTTTISEHATVVGGNWMDETEEEDSQASSLRSLGVDRGHIELTDAEREESQSSGAHHPTQTGLSEHPLANGALDDAEVVPQSGFTWSPDEAERSSLEQSDEYPTADFEASDEDEPDDPDQTGPVPLKNQERQELTESNDSDLSSSDGPIDTAIPLSMDDSEAEAVLAENSDSDSENSDGVRGDVEVEEDSFTQPVTDFGDLEATGGASSEPTAVEVDEWETDSEQSGDIAEEPTTTRVNTMFEVRLYKGDIAEEPTTTRVVSQVQTSEPVEESREIDDDDAEIMGRNRSKTIPILFAVLLLLGVGGYLAWSQGLLEGDSASEEESEDTESIESKSTAEKTAPNKRSERTSRSQTQINDKDLEPLEGGQAYAYPGEAPDSAGTLRMRLNGTFATVELSALKGRYWDGQGQISLTGTPGDEELRVNIFGSPSGETQVRLSTVAEGVVCYVLTVESDGATLQTEVEEESCD